MVGTKVFSLLAYSIQRVCIATIGAGYLLANVISE